MLAVRTVSKSKIFYRFPKPQIRAVFISRPQRFLVETEISDGSKVVAYCANPGSFSGCFRTGAEVRLWDSADFLIKRRFTWRAIKMGRIWIGTDTHLARKLFEAAVAEEQISSLVGYSIQEAEPVVGDRRLDFLLTRGARRCFVEVKSATVSVDRVAQYPDSKSPRAKAHLVALAGKARDGDRAILLFSIQRGDVTAMRVNRGFDRQFDLVFDEARKAGVEVLAVKYRVAPLGFGPPIGIPILC